MFNLNSGSCFIKKTMIRLIFGLALVGLVGTTQAAEPDEDFFVSELNLLTTQFAHAGTYFMPHYQFSASVALTSSPDTTPIGIGIGSTYQLASTAKPQQETAPSINTLWQQTYDGDRVSLPRLLRIEFKGEQGNITFRPRSILIERDRLKIKFRLQSVSIEGERLKVNLQPHSASISWSKAF